MEKHRQLSIKERRVIQAPLTLGFKPNWIAIGLAWSISTINCALQAHGWIKEKAQSRGGCPAIAGKYQAVLAKDRF